MSTEVEINGSTLIPIKEAASCAKYSRDYVSRLAREGKIVASQVGRQWFVDPVSLERFVLEATTLEEVRKEELRAERRRELMAKESLAVLDTVVHKRTRRQRFDAAVVSVAVATLGLVIGMTVYTAQNFLTTPAVLPANVTPSVAITEVTTESPFKVIAEPTDILVTSITADPSAVEDATVEPLSDDLTNGIFLFTNGSLADEESVESLFSDPVEVSFDDEQSGVVIYDRGDGAVSEYPFVRIPTVTEGVRSDQP